jgi:hypothetical protein
MPLLERPFQPTSGGGSAATMAPINVPAVPTFPTLPVKQIVGVATEQVILNPNNPTAPLLVTLPGGKYPYEQTWFDLEMSGIISTAASATATLKLYAGSSVTVGSDTLLGSSGAITQNSATAAFRCHAGLMFDSVSGTLVGEVEFYLNRTRVAAVTLSNFLTGLNQANQIIASFLGSITFSAANAANYINVQRFSVG